MATAAVPSSIGRATRRAVLRGGSVALLGSGALLAACGAPGGTQPSAESAPPYHMVVGDKFGAQGTAPERLEWRDKANAEFNRVNDPKISVEHIVIADLTALTAALAANTGPDVTLASGSWFSDFADKGNLKEITQYVKRDKIDMNRWYLQEEVIIRKGKQYGFPFWQAAGTYFYNKTLFTKNGVKLPDDVNWTWSDMLDAAKKLTQPGQTWGLQMSYGFEFAWINFLRSAGENWINKDKTKTTLNTPGAIDTFQWLVDAVRLHKVMAPPGDTSLGSGNLWQQGKVGIMLAGNGAIGSTTSAKVDFDWDLFVTPKHPKAGKRGVSANDNPWVATKDTKNPEAAYKLCLFYADSFSEGLVGKLRFNMPSLKAAQSDPNSWLVKPPNDIQATLESMKHAQGLDFHLNWNDWNTEITKPLVSAFSGELGVKEACDKASQIGDSLLRGA
jgi:ABC-type glycerol-3-phosphate transport system substrate-binding protein